MVIKKILVADDIFFNRVLLSEIIKELGHTYIEATNGKEALEILQKEDIDIVLMDIEMPTMNGLEATEFIRKKMSPPKSELPVVAITAHDPKSFFEEYQDAGFNELLTKPYTLERLTDILKKFDT